MKKLFLLFVIPLFFIGCKTEDDKPPPPEKPSLKIESLIGHWSTTQVKNNAGEWVSLDDFEPIPFNQIIYIFSADKKCMLNIAFKNLNEAPISMNGLFTISGSNVKISYDNLSEEDITVLEIKERDGIFRIKRNDAKYDFKLVNTNNVEI